MIQLINQVSVFINILMIGMIGVLTCMKITHMRIKSI